MNGRLPTLLALIATVAFTTACTTSADNGPLQSQGAKTNQIRKTPRDQVQDGGTFTWVTDNMPPNFNYHQLDGTEVAASDVSRAFTLSTYDADAAGNPIWNPNLLASEPTVVIEPMAYWPMPGQPKTTSTTSVPPSR